MAGVEAEGQNTEPRIILVRDGTASELIGSTVEGKAVLSVIRAGVMAAINDGSVVVSPFLVSEQAPKRKDSKAASAGSKLTLADLRTPKHFQDYSVYRMGLFLDEEVSLSRPSQEHVDRGQRIKDAGLTTFEPIVFPNLVIAEGFQYPDAWQFPLDSWIYQQIRERNLTSDALNMEERWGWLDVSERLNWKSGDPMFPKTDQVIVDLLTDFRAKGKEDGIEVTGNTRHLNPGSWYGISAVEAETKVFPAMADMIGVERQDVVSLTAAQHNFIGNWLYPHLGEKNSWDWLRNNFGTDDRLIVGYRGGGGLSRVYYYPSYDRRGLIRPRSLVLSPSAA